MCVRTQAQAYEVNPLQSETQWGLNKVSDYRVTITIVYYVPRMYFTITVCTVL